ncbi:MAG TPA: BamA/TamA family outer membrane protein [Candidatus Kapabacteria bacterium]|nr:BamA/TamA family outer membrane protein [Candidatus Kapabacteria bacterium]
MARRPWKRLNALNELYFLTSRMHQSGPAMRTRFRYALLFFISIAGSISFAGLARAQLTGPPGQPSDEIQAGQIVAVKFQGNHQLSSDELGTVITTTASGFSNFLYHVSFHLAGSPYQTLDLPKLQQDTAQLNEYYRDHGFLDARSTYRVTTDSSDLHAYYEYLRNQRLLQNNEGTAEATVPQYRDTVTFHIYEGQPYTISRVAIGGLESLPNEFQPELTEHVTIKTGERWSRPVAAKEVERLMGILIENGYPNVREDSIVVQHTAGYHAVNVLIYFRPGHRFRYGPIHIIYDTTSQEKSRVAADVIRAQLLIDSGHWYRLSDIQRSEANLNSLGTFDLFRISLDTDYINQIPDSVRDSAIVPVIVYLRMKLRAETPISIFMGEGTQGFILGASLGITDKNLFGAADNLSAEGSYQALPATQVRYSAKVDYLRPYIGLGRVPLITGVGVSEQTQLAATGVVPYNEFSLTAHAGSNFILSRTDNKTTLTPDLLVAYVTNSVSFANPNMLAMNMGPADSNTLKKRVDSISSADSSTFASLPHQQKNLLPSITYQDDRRNDPINPTSGDLLSASLEIGVPSPFLSDSSSDYIKFVPQVSYYYDLSKNGTAVLAGHLLVGYSYLLYDTVRYHDPALDHRFYGGGGSSERGWGEQSLLVSEDSNRAANLGGYNDFEASLELRFAPFQYPAEFTTWQKFSSDIRVVLFYDAGNVWDQMAQVNRTSLKLNQIAQSIGIGLRYNTFFGALRIDWGFKLYDPSGKFNNDGLAITPASHGEWLFSSARKGPLVSFGNTCNINFGIGQAF